jgi:N-acyl homoserine lactone hydrolase
MTKIDMLLHGFTLGTNQGSAGFCGVTLLEGSKRILVDAAHVGRRQLVLQALRDRGLTSDDIDYVFLTHAHWDHMLNVDLFPNAKILVHPLEREYCKAPKASDYATPKYVTQILESMQLQEVCDGEEIDDGVTVLETPGHSRGSMALLVRSGDGTAAISGDALPTGGSVASGLPRLIFWDQEQAGASIRKLLDRAQTFYPGHDRPFRVGDSSRVTYLEATSIKVFGWPEPGEGEGGPGLVYSAEPPGGGIVVE